MGKRGGQRGGRGRGGQFGRQRKQRADYEEVSKTNDLFEKYYKESGFILSSEQDDFWAALRRELPNSFRFTGSKGRALPVQRRLKDHYIPEITSIQHNGETVDPPTALAWYPDQLGWQMTTPKNVVRRFPPFASFQKFLVSETSVGNISRQEAVSMIPPLLMDVTSSMTVLDLCAAPGSKAAQLIEMIHSGEEARVRQVLRKLTAQKGQELNPDDDAAKEPLGKEKQDGDWSDDGRSTGLLIANDADYKRAHMLIHQLKRLNSPNLIVTNHDATQYPSLKLPSDPIHKGGVPKGKYLKFDRILADVPCSGDGTCRKNPGIWRDWSPNNALGLHSTQVRILVRSLQMLKVGGRVVYSTCSMNPVENEAVIASAIDRCGGSRTVEILDCRDALPELKRRPGLSTWKVMDKQGKIWSSWQQVEEFKAEKGSEGLAKLVEGMFSPNDNKALNPEIPLSRCLRVYGHLQDTGGFFITVLEKKSEIKARPEAEPKILDSTKRLAEQHTSIISVIDEIEAKPTNGENPIEKIDALDELAPPVDYEGEAEGPSAAARQNQENLASESISDRKREIDDLTDAQMSVKRPKFRDEVDEAAPRGAEDRQVHWPPPPGAQLDISRSEVSSLPEPSLPPPAHKKKRNSQPFEEPYKYLDPEHAQLCTIYNFYHLDPRFPKDRFMVRNAAGDPAKTIYYTSTLARTILTQNEGKGIKFVHCGVKMFVKQDVQKEGVCQWRIQNEGLPILESWVGEERVVRLYNKLTLKALLIEMFPKVTDSGWRALGEIGERVRDIDMGCCVLRVEKGEGDESFSERMVLPLWRSLYSLNLMLPKEDRKAMLLRIYNDMTPLMDHSKDRLTGGSNSQSKSKETTLHDEEDRLGGDDDISMAMLDASPPTNGADEKTNAAQF